MQQAVTNSEYEVAFFTNPTTHATTQTHRAQRWHHQENDEHDEDVEHDEHVVHGDTKRDQTWRH